LQKLIVEWVQHFRQLSEVMRRKQIITLYMLDSIANLQPIRFASSDLNESKTYREERWKNLGGKITIKYSLFKLEQTV